MNNLEAAAGHAVLTGQIRSFTAWAGTGRKLTQTGRIGLADARHLDGRGRVLAALDRGPAEGGRDPAGVLGVEHVDRAEGSAG
jgi:hypothetical protein